MAPTVARVEHATADASGHGDGASETGQSGSVDEKAAATTTPHALDGLSLDGFVPPSYPSLPPPPLLLTAREEKAHGGRDSTPARLMAALPREAPRPHRPSPLGQHSTVSHAVARAVADAVAQVAPGANAAKAEAAEAAAVGKASAAVQREAGWVSEAALARFAGAQVEAHVSRVTSAVAPSVASDAPQYMAAVLQVVAAQMLQRAGDAARDGQSARIEPHHIRVAVRGDDDLARLVGEEALEQGGLLRPSEEMDEDAPA